MLSDIRKVLLADDIKKSRPNVEDVSIENINEPDFKSGYDCLRIKVAALDAATNKVFVSDTTISEYMLENAWGAFDEDKFLSILWEMIDSSVAESRPK